MYGIVGVKDSVFKNHKVVDQIVFVTNSLYMACVTKIFEIKHCFQTNTKGIPIYR